MDLVYSTYNDGGRRGRAAPSWTRETNALCSVSCQNILVFSSAHSDPLLDDGKAGVNRVYCADLNSPWDISLVCTLGGPASSLCWDGSGTKVCVGDRAGNIAILRMSESCVSEWTEVYSASLAHERIIKTGFLASARVVTLNKEKKDSIFYNEKFQFGPEGVNSFDSEVCVFISGSGLLSAVLLNNSGPALTATACVGRNRSRLDFVDLATSTTGDFLLAACGAETPVTVHMITCSLTPQDGLQIHLTNHSSFCVADRGGPEVVRISALKFVLADSSDAIVVGVDGEEGGRVRMWELQHAQHTCHKLFSQSLPSPKRKLIPTWRYCAEFAGGGTSKVNVLTTPSTSFMGGDKPSCYVVVGFADGTIQCLIRDNLQQIAYVELPRLALDNLKMSETVTICDMKMTSTGTGLVVTDSYGQIYLYRMSPIADPGGPHMAPYLVTMYEYCLVSGRDWWDLSLAAAQTNILTVTDKLEETFSKQPSGLKNYCYYRYMAIKASLFRLAPQCEYRAADTLALMMLKSIYGDVSSLLSVDGGYFDQDPAEKLGNILRTCSSATELDTVVSSLVSTGFVRELPLASEAIQNLEQLSSWVITLALHLLSALPEFKTRRGPGFWLMQDGGLTMIRDLLVMMRLWALPRPGFITREKDLDLNAKLFSMTLRLKDNPEDEKLHDECLILPSLVIVPGLDVMVAPTGVLAALHAGAHLPLSFSFGVEPNLSLPPQPLFLEGLPYMDGGGRNTFDAIRKTALGRNPANLRRCSRCRSHTQGTPSKPGALRSWEKRWDRNCCCGGSWKLIKNS